MKDFYLEIKHIDKQTGARYGILHTPHGDVEVPMFMPVGTLATVKTLSPEELVDMGAGVILANTYHLSIRPGADIVAKAGGLHKFMNWNGPILTDSGGFQVFSLADNRKISEEGVQFKNHLNGDKLFFSPEIAIDIQEKLGADIIMSLDECIPYPSSYEYTKKSTERTIRWANRGLQAHKREDQALFGIVQGGDYEDLRRYCAEELSKMDFQGYSIGGTSIGEPKEVCFRMVEYAVKYLPQDKPRYLMGVGSIDYLLGGIARGVDMFDCVMPTRNARNGTAFTLRGNVPVKAGRYADDPRPLSSECGCPVCQRYSRRYLRHLFNVGETMAGYYVTLHNLYFYLTLMEKMRNAIAKDEFVAFAEEFLAKRQEGADE